MRKGSRWSQLLLSLARIRVRAPEGQTALYCDVPEFVIVEVGLFAVGGSGGVASENISRRTCHCNLSPGCRLTMPVSSGLGHSRPNGSSTFVFGSIEIHRSPAGETTRKNLMFAVSGTNRKPYSAAGSRISAIGPSPSRPLCRFV